METGCRRERGRSGFVACSRLSLLGFLPSFAFLTAMSPHVAESFLSPSDSPIFAICFAKLPYALVETLRSPCRLRSFISLGADNLGSEISPLLFSNGCYLPRPRSHPNSAMAPYRFVFF